MKRLLIFAFLVLSLPAAAQEEPFSEGVDLAQPEGDASTVTKKEELNADTPAAPAPDSAEDDEEEGDAASLRSQGYASYRPWTIAPGFGFSGGGYNVHLSVTYNPSVFYGYQVSGFFDELKRDDIARKVWGGEIDGIGYLRNSSIVTPFAGAGPGFEKWMISYQENAFDSGISPTLNLFAGVEIALGQHVSLLLSAKQVTFLMAPPKDPPDPDKRQEKSVSFFDMAFVFSF